jgi:hypothetical protein
MAQSVVQENAERCSNPNEPGMESANDAVYYLLTVAFVACPGPHGDTVMVMLKLECSRTGRLVETGIETDWRSFQSLADFRAKTFCPYCNRHHVWSKGNVSVEPAYPFMFIRTNAHQKALQPNKESRSVAGL